MDAEQRLFATNASSRRCLCETLDVTLRICVKALRIQQDLRCEPARPGGKALARLVSGRTQVRFPAAAHLSLQKLWFMLYCSDSLRRWKLVRSFLRSFVRWFVYLFIYLFISITPALDIEESCTTSPDKFTDCHRFLFKSSQVKSSHL